MLNFSNSLELSNKMTTLPPPPTTTTKKKQQSQPNKKKAYKNRQTKKKNTRKKYQPHSLLLNSATKVSHSSHTLGSTCSVATMKVSSTTLPLARYGWHLLSVLFSALSILTSLTVIFFSINMKLFLLFLPSVFILDFILIYSLTFSLLLMVCY